MLQTSSTKKCDSKNIDIENLLKDYDDNKISIENLKQKYGVSDKVFFNLIKKYNPVRRDSLSVENMEKFLVDYQSNTLSSLELQEKYNRSIHILNSIAKKKGVFRKKSKRIFDKEFKDSVIEDYKSLMTLTEIYKKYKLTQYMMNNIIDEYDVRFDKDQQSKDHSFLILTESQKDNICEEYCSKIPILEIIDKHNITKTALEKILDERNIKYGQKERVDEKKAKIIQLYTKGISTTKMADIISMGQGDISKYLKDNDVSLRPTDFYNRRYTVDHDYFEVIDTHDKAYILGLLAADGYVEDKKHTVNIGLQERDKYCLEWVNSCLGSNAPIKLSQKKNNLPHGKNGFNHRQDHYKMTVCSPKMQKDLSKYGIVHRKTWCNQSMPVLDDEFLGAYLLGYCDGDGYVGFYNRNRTIIKKHSVQKVMRTDCRWSIILLDKMAHELQEILQNKFAIKTQINKCCGKYSIPLVNIQSSAAESLIKLYHLMYDNVNFCMKRKHDKFILIMNNLEERGHDIGTLRNFDPVQ